MGKKAKLDLTPEKRAEMARMQERLQLIGEGLGLRKAATARREPQAPMLRKSRKPGGGNKPKLIKDEVDHAKQTFLDILDKDPTWAGNQEAAAKHLLKVLKLGDRVSWQTVKRRIVAPVLKALRSK
jgi:hypothetical protein